ncbi:hypothetical protein Forpe1208_v013965 [Fusarium oxysporum f. sp. rapae]|uniref:Uncharacterized protein n=1 Tax=Fusarium oxysporum f. sp. rapae TaxID=485398 RepID=A0A8J5NJ63_FUSOX|nr:hypothetical protein Forpe1208_v013965 [Fusarium oxysporum f. sp. rapae]
MSKQKIGDIPKITPLQTALGFPRSDPASRFFIQAYKKFIEGYKTRDGVPGVSLIKWSDGRQRFDLETMAKRFAIIEGRGQQFWPASESSSSGNSMIWGQDAEKIVKLLAQLFFRHNQQEHQKGPNSPSKKKQAARHERQRSQTLGQSNAVSASVLSEEMDTDAWHEDTSDDDDSSLPDIDHFRLHPRGPDAQTSPENNIGNTTPPPQGSTAAINPPSNTGVSSEPTAPVAQMTERLETTAATETATRAIDTLTERYTSSGRSCRPVQRLNFVETPTFDTEDDSQSLSPPPSRQSDPGSRLSPELGTDTRGAAHVGTSQNPRATSEPMSFDKTQLSTEDITPVLEENQATRSMPPPPLPQATCKTPEITTRRPRYGIKYSVEKSPGNLTLWEHHGTFGRMPMSEFQFIHGFDDIDAVQFVVQREGRSWDDRVHKNDDVAFQDMKVRFRGLIRNDLDGLGPDSGFIPYDIWIIPIRSSESEEKFVREQTIAL